MTTQISLLVYGTNNRIESTPYTSAFQATLKAYPDKLTGVPAVNSRIQYLQGKTWMEAFVGETVSQIADLINGAGIDGLKWDDGDNLLWDDGDNVKFDA